MNLPSSIYVYLFRYSFVYLSIHSFIYSFIYLSIYVISIYLFFIYVFIYLLIYIIFIYLLIYLSIYLCIYCYYPFLVFWKIRPLDSNTDVSNEPSYELFFTNKDEHYRVNLTLPVWAVNNLFLSFCHLLQKIGKKNDGSLNQILC